MASNEVMQGPDTYSGRKKKSLTLFSFKRLGNCVSTAGGEENLNKLPKHNLVWKYTSEYTFNEHPKTGCLEVTQLD